MSDSVSVKTSIEEQKTLILEWQKRLLKEDNNMLNNEIDDQELEQLLAPPSEEGLTNPTIDDTTVRSTFKQIIRLMMLNTAKVEQQLENLQQLIDEDKSITKEVEINGIVISIKFKSGVPLIPLTEAFAINLAATKLIQQLVSTPDGKPRASLDCDSLDL